MAESSFSRIPSWKDVSPCGSRSETFARTNAKSCWPGVGFAKRRRAPLHEGRRLLLEDADLQLRPSHQRHERARDLGVELRPGTVFDVLQRGVRRPRRAIGTIGPQRVEDVAHVHESARVVAFARKV